MLFSEVRNSIGATCEVRTMENELLMTGRLRAVGDETIDIAAMDGDRLPVTFYNTSVKVNIYSEAGRVALGGTTYISNEDFWRLTNVQLFSQAEKRSFFRVRTTAKAELLFDPDKPPQGDEPDERTRESVTLYDVSLCGIGYWSEHPVRLGQLIEISYLTLIKGETPLRFFGRVQRVQEARIQGFPIGVSIEGIKPRDQDRMCRAIFSLQREEIQKRKR